MNLSPNELFGVTGMSVDIAWRKQTGRSDVVIAVHDSGFKWNDDGAVNDLRKKFHLNRRRAAGAGAGRRLHAAGRAAIRATATATASSTCPTTTATRR